VLGDRAIAEVDEEVEIPRRLAADAGSEEIQPAHAQARADFGDFRAVCLDFALQNGAHG